MMRFLLSRRMRGAAVVAGALIVGLAVGVIAQRAGIPRRLRTEARRAVSAFSREGQIEANTRPVVYRQISTNLFDLEEATIEIGPVGGTAIAAIEEFGQGLIFVELEGELGYLSFNGAIRYLDHRVPMNIVGLYDWLDSSKQPIFPQRFRALDGLLVQASDRATLYVSHRRFASECVQFVVSATSATIGEDGPVLDAKGLA